MLSTSFAAFRKTTSSYFKSVIDNHENLIVNRGKDSAFMVLSLDDYISTVEACHGDTSELKEILDRQALTTKMKIESELVPEESMNFLHEFDAIENPDETTMEPDNLIQKPPSGVRTEWEQSFQRMHAEGDDQLFIPDVFEDEAFEDCL